MALDAKHRSSIYGKLLPLLGEEDANAIMSEFPSVEADELVTRQFLRAELALLRGEMAGLRTEMEAGFHQQTVRLYTALGVAVAILGTMTRLG